MNQCTCKEFEEEYRKSKKFGCYIGSKKCLWCHLNNQPERSKREDIDDLGHDFVTVGCTDHTYCIKCHEESHVVKSKMMRCSELYGDIEKLAEMTSSPVVR